MFGAHRRHRRHQPETWIEQGAIEDLPHQRQPEAAPLRHGAEHDPDPRRVQIRTLHQARDPRPDPLEPDRPHPPAEPVSAAIRPRHVRSSPPPIDPARPPHHKAHRLRIRLQEREPADVVQRQPRHLRPCREDEPAQRAAHAARPTRSARQSSRRIPQRSVRMPPRRNDDSRPIPPRLHESARGGVGDLQRPG